MWISDTSVKRPVFAAVISLMLVAFGIICFDRLPLRELPDTDAPIVSIETFYPGASAEVVESQITEVIEERISGIQGIKTISSQSAEQESSITIEFVLGRDIDSATNDVRDRVSRVIDSLPEEADPPEVVKQDSDTDVIMWLNLVSDERTSMELTDYAERNLVEALSIVEGVARVRNGGGRNYAMRVWLDRIEMAGRGVTTSDIENALRAENVELPAGRIESEQREFTVRVERLYETEQDFRNLVIREEPNGDLLRLGDVARVEVGPSNERSELRGNGKEMIGLGITRQSTANILDVAEGVRETVAQLQLSLPSDIELIPSYDTSVFIQASIDEVYRTLFIAMGLVIVVIFFFLGSVRASLVPAITVPVSLIASFIFLYALGFSLNLITLLALVLAIGLVVDDSIVVLENIARRIEGGEPPLLAAYRGARQVGFAVIATTLVLIAVFVPIAFLQGAIGRLFTEFGLAMAAAVACSSLVALTLSPMLCSKLLKAKDPAHRPNWLIRSIDGGFQSMSQVYRGALEGILRMRIVVLLLFFGLIAGSLFLAREIPQETAPQEDRGAFFIPVVGPEGSGYEYSKRQMRKVEDIMMQYVEAGAVSRALARLPLGFGPAAPVNGGFAIVVMEPWGERTMSTFEVINQMRGQLFQIPGIRAFPVMRSGISSSRGDEIQFVLQGPDYETLARWRDIVLDEVRSSPEPFMTGEDSDYKETKPQFEVFIDKDRAADLGVSVREIGRTLETMMGSRRTTTYIFGGEEYDVILQGRDSDRRTPDDLRNVYVRSERTGELIPLNTLVELREVARSAERNRFNRQRAITLSGNPVPGVTTGEALDRLNQIVNDNLPEEAKVDYKGKSLEFIEASSGMLFVFGLALVIVFLVLAAQFESFIHPFIIMMAVPTAVAGAFFGLFMMDSTLNIYSRIGIIMLVGLAAKNGILIVEFANQLRNQGRAVREALLEASQIRLRPVLMTAISTVVGAFPLVASALPFFEAGPGSESRLTIGIVIISGVTAATFLTLFLIPVFYDLLARFTKESEAVEKEIHRLDAEVDRIEEQTRKPALTS